MDNQELLSSLAQFTGTEAYHRYSRMFPNVIITDGVRFLADQTGGYWLLDVIASHLPAVPKDEGFVIALLDAPNDNDKLVNNAKFTLCNDIDNGKPVGVYAKQAIEYTDFPLPHYKLYVSRSEFGWVVMLPSEY